MGCCFLGDSLRFLAIILGMCDAFSAISRNASGTCIVGEPKFGTSKFGQPNGEAVWFGVFDFVAVVVASVITLIL